MLRKLICSRGNDINNDFLGFITTLTGKDLSIDVQRFVVNRNVGSVQVALVKSCKQVKKANKS